MGFTTKSKARFIEVLKGNKIDYKIGWSNFMQNVRNPGAVVIDVANQSQLQLVLKEVAKLNKSRQPDNKITVRATAGWENSKGASCCFFSWNNVQENEYNESFSFSQVVGGRASETSKNSEGTDVIIRFKKKFHHARVLGAIETPPTLVNPDSPIHQLPSFLVEVSAGMQVAEFCDFLRSKNLSLSTVSMISWVSLVGLAGTAGHGTGRDEPAFSGLIEAITVCDMNGTIRELKAGDPDFEVLRGGHSGLLGVVLSMKIRAVQAFNLEETVDVFVDAKEMSGKLQTILKNNQYISFLGMPSASDLDLSKQTHKWQIRKWNHTTEKPTQKGKPTYAAGTTSLLQEVEVRLGAEAMGVLVGSELKHLLPSFMLLAATEAIGTRGTKPIVNFENDITHPQVSFPKFLRDVDYFIPVDDAEAGDVLEAILQLIERLVDEAAARGEYPITYAVYVRYLKGTNGGLSTSSTSSPDERILALDIVTHPYAPGITRFEQEFMRGMNELGLNVRNHLGKNFPSGITRYDQFLDPKDIDGFMSALERWYATPGEDDGAEQLAMSPFYTPYLQKMLDLAPVLEKELVKEKRKAIPLVKKDDSMEEARYIAFLGRLARTVESFSVSSDSAQEAKDVFLKACQDELERRQPQEEATSSLKLVGV